MAPNWLMWDDREQVVVRRDVGSYFDYKSYGTGT